ncbi:MAG: hypothetical protein LBN96_01425 [Desulfovibrio sp.]|jgi:hypothetical protein|nr:hypothetical protein [Desulfovibrio sp.]
MKAIQEFLAAWPVLWTLLETLCVLIPMAAMLAYSGIGFVSTLAGILGRVRKRASFGKCAHQLALLGFVLGWLLLIGARVWLFLARMDNPAICAWMTEACWFLLAGSVLVASLYYALWKHMSKYPATAVILGVSGGLAACVALFAALVTMRCYALGLQVSPAGKNLSEIVTLFLKTFAASGNNMPFWNALWYTPALIVAFAAGLGSLWLFARRRRDDFGRDHYNTMIAWCARLSRNAWGLLWMLLLVFSIFQPRLSSDIPGGIWPGLAAETAYLLFWAIPALLWAFAGRSAVPLRHAMTLLAALCLAGTFLVPYYLEICAG